MILDPLNVPVLWYPTQSTGNESSYSTDFFSIFGTIVLWVLWPSINAALAKPTTQLRVVINTVLSLCTSCIFTFWVSRTFRRRRFGIRDIQHATIAGGIAMSSTVSATIIPGAAMLVGAITGTVVTIGVAYIKPWLDSPSRKVSIHDTRGSIQLHGVSGLISVFAGIVATSIANNDHVVFGEAFSDVFREGSNQPGLQAAALFISIGIGLVGGFVTSLLVYFLIPSNFLYFSDEEELVLTLDFDRSLPLVQEYEYKPVSTIRERDGDVELEEFDKN